MILNGRKFFDLIGNMPVNRDYKLEWGKIDEDKIKKVLMEHDFSEERINIHLGELIKSTKSKAQKGLGEFLDEKKPKVLS